MKFMEIFFSLIFQKFKKILKNSTKFIRISLYLANFYTQKNLKRIEKKNIGNYFSAIF